MAVRLGLSRVGSWLVYLLLRVIVCIVQAVPITTCDQWCRALGWFAYRVLRLRRETVDQNLAHAFPELSWRGRQRIALGMWRHLLLIMCELAHVPRKIHRTNWHRYVACPQVEQQVGYFLSPRPLVIVSGHFGNFEVGGVLAGLLGVPTYTIARPLDNPYLHRFITRFRSATGQFMLPKQGSAADANLVLQRGGSLVLLGDQYGGPKGCWIEFFGRPASCHKAVALFALMHQAPLLVSYARRLDKPLHFEVGLAGVFDPREHPGANVRQVTQWFHDCLEQLVRRDPDQYWWLHRRWKDTRPPNVSRVGRAEAPRPLSAAAVNEHISCPARNPKRGMAPAVQVDVARLRDVG